MALNLMYEITDCLIFVVDIFKIMGYISSVFLYIYIKRLLSRVSEAYLLSILQSLSSLHIQSIVFTLYIWYIHISVYVYGWKML